MNEKLRVVNLFGGPGCGKSTTRAGLFNLMKLAGTSVEEVTEFAKDVTWDENQTLLADQLFVLANQNRRLTRIANKVKWSVSDSPILLSIHYKTPEYLPKTFADMVFELWNTYDNYNFFIERTKPYDPVGRNQTAEEAIEIDNKIKEMLTKNDIRYMTVRGGAEADRAIFSMLFGMDKLPK